MATLGQLLQHALQHHQAGQLAEAERIYRQALELDPRNPDALHLLGLAAHHAGNEAAAVDFVQQAARYAPENAAILNSLAGIYCSAGRFADARKCCRKILAVKPDNAEAHNNLGMAQKGLGVIKEAEQSFRRAIALRPDHAEAHNNLGVILDEDGRLPEAEQSYRRALALKPDSADAHCNHAITLHRLGRLNEAENSCRRALALRADFPKACNTLGNILKDLGRLPEAEQYYREAVALKSDYFEAHYNLGNILKADGRFRDAELNYRESLALRPGYAEAHNNLGTVLRELGAVREAEQSYRRALALDARSSGALSNLGVLLVERGDIDEGIASIRAGLKQDPGDILACNALLLSLNYVPGLSAEEIYGEHVAFAKRFCPAGPIRPHGNLPDPSRRLRIGYVSGDLREHPVGQFIEPVLRAHDRTGFEVYCYSNHPRADERTARLRGFAHAWREVFALDDAGMEALIREDAIDILVDLSGHTGGNRLPVFGRKPAPVQATWLGYLNTTGLATIDWRITDAKASPEALKAYHSERLLYLPDSQWCYQAPPNCPEASPPPSLSAGHITFGAFTNLAKIGAPVIELWCRLLDQVPHSRLLVLGNGLGAIGEEVMARFTRHGAAPDRIELRNAVPFGDYLALHARVDIMLDTFPYAGGTTTCHALWMGVPIVTLTGTTAPSCGGASLLNVIGLPELVAHTPDEYLKIATALAQDSTRLSELRAGLRERMSASPLTDAARFTRNLESAYRSMWQQWCESAKASN